MDPISALNVATAVAQFIEFSASLVSTSREIFSSAKGATADNLALETVYSHLSQLSDKLGTTIQPSPPGQPSVKQKSHQEELGKALQSLSAQCKSDCDELLALCRKLKVDPSDNHRRWRSLKAGLATLWGERKMQELQKRTSASQQQLTLLVGDFVRESVIDMNHKLTGMRQHNEVLHRAHSTKLDSVCQALDDLRLDLRGLNEDSDDAVDYSNALCETATAEVAMPADIVERMAVKLQGLMSGYLILTKQDVVLRTLNFPARSVRREDIPEAYDRTFQWIFRSVGFSDWLRTGSGIFWVSGRAGSGKSTLMKFLAAKSTTSELLADWGGSKHVSTVCHYFWSAGNEMQHSQLGLLRSILFDIFLQCPECIPIACPTRWENANAQTGDARQSSSWLDWELRAALNVLAGHPDLPAKFCFFIDGLDEFDGDALDMCHQLTELSKSPHFKLCVSSRPLPVFEDAFEPYPKLAVHDFTRGDIEHFAKDRLQSHPKWAQCAAEENEKAEMVQTITNRAEGVFLWVFLVTKSLREGLSNDDNIHELEARLESLPARLENLFKHMLDSVNVVYHAKMASNFLLALHADGPLLLDVYGYHDHEHKDEDYAIHWPVKVVGHHDLTVLRARTRRRVNVRSAGLLEARGAKVEFLHRTVRDFLRLREMRDYLMTKLSPQFDPPLAIARAYVALIKSSQFSSGTFETPSGTLTRPVVRISPGDNGGALVHFIQQCISSASDAAEARLSSVAALLEELEYALDDMFSAGQVRFSSPATCAPALLVRELVLQSNSHAFLTAQLTTANSSYLSDFEAPPLFVASRPPIRGATLIPVLLQHGAQDPNAASPAIQESTPWLAFLGRVSPWSSLPSGQAGFNPAMSAGLFSSFLAHGADANAFSDRFGLTAFGIFLTALFAHTPLDQKAYLRTLDDFFNAGADVHAAAKSIAWAVDRRSGLDMDRRSPPDCPDGTRGSTTVLEILCYCLRHCAEAIMAILDSVGEDVACRRGPRRAGLLRSVVKNVLARGEMKGQPEVKRALRVGVGGWMDSAAMAELFGGVEAAASTRKRWRGLDVEERNPRPRSPGEPV